MKILVIGYRNHSAKILKILSKIKLIKKIFIYKKSKNNFKTNIKNSKIVDHLNNLDSYDCFFILSPNKTHTYYIKKFINFKKKIFCEKPACVNIKEYKFLNNLPNKKKRNIYFNFNLRHSKLYKTTLNYVKNKKLGKLHHIYFKESNGISFKKSLNKSNRFKSNDVFDRITGNIGVHYINYFLGLQKNKINLFFNEGKIFKKKSEFSKIDLIGNNFFSSIFLTYSSIADYRADLVFTNGILKFDNDSIKLAYPRDSFDKNGNFIYPKEKVLHKFDSYKKYTELSFISSIKYFLNITKYKKNFLIRDYDDALKSSYLILNAKNK